MPTETISFKATGYFSSFICNYLENADQLKPYYSRFPDLANFKQQIEEKKTFPHDHRVTLFKALEAQYASLKNKEQVSEKTWKNIQLLKESNTFTITTGHQLNLFTGPLYFLYKILSTINLCEELKVAYPNNNFVPIYWMASEDHDFEEINYFNFKGKKIAWKRNDGGAVGEFSTEGLNEVFDKFSEELGPGKNAEQLKRLFKESYLEHDNLSEATRYLANELFKIYGLVVIDANDKELKALLKPYVQRELFEQVAFNEVNNTVASFPDDFPVQVNPREINLFYIKEGIRERIIRQNDVFYVNESSIQFTEEAIKKELENYPERFSPNALLRPFYQEVILPNLCYIGGGGELAYWFELKSTFKNFEIPFPMLLLRNSALLISEKQQLKLEKLNLEISELFEKQNVLFAQQTKRLSSLPIDLSQQKHFLKKQFETLYDVAKQTDASFVGAVAAQERKQIKGLEHLEKRLLKAEKKRLASVLDRVKNVQDAIFPKQSLQERNTNFSEFYLEYGDELISRLKRDLKPLINQFLIIDF